MECVVFVGKRVDIDGLGTCEEAGLVGERCRQNKNRREKNKR